MNEQILLLSNILLVIFTGVYVILTSRLLRATIKNNNINNRINSLPLLDCRILDQNKKYRLNIKNISNNPAFDIDIWFFGILFDSSVSKRKILNKYILGKENKLTDKDKLLFVEDGQYAVSERGTYATLPMDRYIDYEINYPFKIEQFEIFIQYRDHLGNNYGQLVWFFESTNNELKLGNISPSVIKPIERIDLTDERISLKKIPEEFHFMIKRNIASVDGRHILKNDDFSIENRWNIK